MFYFSFFLVIVGKKISMTMFIMMPQGSLNRLHEPDYTRKDAFLIGIFMVSHILEQCMMMNLVLLRFLILLLFVLLLISKVEAKNIKISDIFYFLNDSTIKKGNKAYKLIRDI